MGRVRSNCNVNEVTARCMVSKGVLGSYLVFAFFFFFFEALIIIQSTFRQNGLTWFNVVPDVR